MNTGMMELNPDQMTAAGGEVSTEYCVGRVLRGAGTGFIWGGMAGGVIGCMVGGGPGQGIGMAAGAAIGSIAGAIHMGATIEDK